MTAPKIAWALATSHSSPFHVRKHQAVIPNVSWGFLPWEADLLVLLRSGYLTEIEIKISMADWRADSAKAKHRQDFYPDKQKLIRRLFYACPYDLATRFEEAGIPPTAGVIGIQERKVVILRPAVARPGAIKPDTDDVITLLRLAAIKAWKMAHNPALEPFEDIDDV